MVVSQIKKRDGTIVSFKPSKVASALEKTMLAVSVENDVLLKELTDKVIAKLNEGKLPDFVPTVEEIQDVVETVLINEGHAQFAKAYILYRQKRAELRKEKQNILGRLDDSKLSVNGLLVAKSRYLQILPNGVIETPKEMFFRVAKAVSNAEKKYNKTPEYMAELEEDFLEILSSLEFVPSGRILANAGTQKGMLYSSFVIPIEDSMKGIFRALYDKALVQRLGGGTGF
ncbi:MAG: hypothetical protein HGA85_08985, partial [Nanoarchaeota archaeon]|nr:hypothetical protein [Nanoarchaeota archaeon]